MKVVILAGGLGTRLAEETDIVPKPMVEIGARPIIWHIMKHYAYYGFNEFFIALGYKGEVIKRYFLEYYHISGDITVDLHSGANLVHHQEQDNWIIHMIDTGTETNTGGRLFRLKEHLQGSPFLLTYGDGVSNIDLNALVTFHRRHGLIGTVSAVRPPSRFGELVFEQDLVAQFNEKPQIGEGWINGGFMVFNPQIFDYLHTDHDSLESYALEQLAVHRQLAAYRHGGFWQCMDTLRDKRLLNRLWIEGNAPWKVWQ